MGDVSGAPAGISGTGAAPDETTRGVVQLLLRALLRADWPSLMLGSARLLPPLGPMPMLQSKWYALQGQAAEQSCHNRASLETQSTLRATVLLGRGPGTLDASVTPIGTHKSPSLPSQTVTE